MTTKKTITEYRTPSLKNTDLVFAAYQNKQNPDPSSLYSKLAGSFAKTLDRMGKGGREDSNKNADRLHSILLGDL